MFEDRRLTILSAVSSRLTIELDVPRTRCSYSQEEGVFRGRHCLSMSNNDCFNNGD